MPILRPVMPALGLVTLADHIADPLTGNKVSSASRFRQFVELGELAEALGFRSIHLGEHNFNDYVVSSPTPVLAAIAEHTHQLRLSTAVSLLPNHDPVRIAEDYATVDVLSGGRVEIGVGKGILPSLYRQYGQDVGDAEALLLEAVALLRRLWTEENVTWDGLIRPPLDAVTIRPRPLQQPHPPLWLSASSAASVARAVNLRCPIGIPTISTGVAAPAQLARSYRALWTDAGLPDEQRRVALHVHCYVGDSTTKRAIERWRPHQLAYLEWVMRIARPDGGPLPPSWSEFDTPDAIAVCGNAQAVANELARRIVAMGGVDELMVQSDQGALPFDEACRSLTRFATDVAPLLNELLAETSLKG